MSIKKLSFMLLSTLSLAALLNGCGSSNKEGVIGGVAKVDESKCRVCHANSIDSVSRTNIVQDFVGTADPLVAPSVHFQLPDGAPGTGCQGCHGGGAQHNGVGPIPFPSPLTAGRCNVAECHNNKIPAGFVATDYVAQCAGCHNGSGIHGIQFTDAALYNDCVGCHALGQAKHGNGVDDNNGVRAITAEFGKWSHHVTGVALQNAHCAACHLEGKVQDGQIVVDRAYHMADAKTHLRNVDTDADMEWDPAAPSHSTMDSFCMSCHDAGGATSAKSAAIRALMVPAAGKTASATNPFGDTISNQYDQEERPAVVDAKGQFAKGNNSHHAVLGKKYTGRTRNAADPRAVAHAALSGTGVVGAFNQYSSPTMPGGRSTIFDAGKFNATYTTLADAAGETNVTASLSGRNGGTTLGDDSTLHCGDCHTVGQWKPNAAKNFDGSNAPDAIGAHGSNNEYMLRNMIGTDQRHQGVESATTTGAITGLGTKPYLVCFNCHDITTYGAPKATSGEGHSAEYAQRERCNGPYNTVFGALTGEARLQSMITIPAGYGTFAGSGKFYGNMFGIQCANCHNSGVKGNLFGGIHGSKTQTYTDGMGNTTKHNRFMPGLGNVMFVPGVKGGFTGGTLATYKAYSSNRLTGAALVQTELPVRTIKYTGAGDNTNGSYQYVTGGVSNDLNWEQSTQQSIAGETDLQSKAMGCYTLDANPIAPVAGADARWLAAVPGGSNYQVAMVNPALAAIAVPAGQKESPKVAFLAANGYPANDVRYAAAYRITAGDGREMFDVWGGCDDHNNAQGAGTSFRRKVIRKTTY